MEVAPMEIWGESGDKEYGDKTAYGMFEVFSISFQTGDTSSHAGTMVGKDSQGKKITLQNTNNTQQKAGPPQDAGDNRVGKLTFEKPIDKSSPFLFRYCCEKTVMPWAIIYIREAGEEPAPGASTIPWLRIEMQQVKIIDFSWDIDPGAGGDEVNKAEKIQFSFDTMLVCYSEQSIRGRHEQVSSATNMWNFADQTGEVPAIPS
jgi:type VI protein secretion system component Hcp